MAPAEWDEILEIFHAARGRSGSDRAMLLDSACGENTLFRRAVEDMLEGDESAEGFLSQPRFSLLTSELHAKRIVAGQRFGRYVIEALLGQGGMGEVWSARDTDLERPVALKFLSPEALAALDAEQITLEAKAASALNHPNIVTIHEVMRSESAFAIVMELVEGAPLRRPSGEILPIAEVLAIGSQIAEALAAAHGGGIIHADIKPENIFLRLDGYIKLLDFGLAHRITTDTLAIGGRPALGTLRYLSPEQARGEPLTTATDIFSFGLVLYELTTGRHAFQRTSALDTARAILNEEPPPACSVNPSVPARLDLLIRAMLAKDSVARPSAAEVARTLKELQRPRKIPSVLQWLLAVLALAVVSVSVWRWKQAQQMSSAPEPVLFSQITRLPPERRATAAAISPDGRLTAYANVDGIFVKKTPDGESKALSAPADYVVDRLAWFTDGRKLVASGFSASTLVPSIWLISLDGASPHLLRSKARAAAPSPDGKWIAFVTENWSEIRVAGANGEELRRVAAGPGNDTFSTVFWSPDSKRINFQRSHLADAAQGSESVESVESVLATTAKVTNIAFNISMSSASALPDGRVLFLRTEQPTSASPDQVWEVKTDPSTGRFLDIPHKIGSLTLQQQPRMSGMSVASDGKRIVVLRGSLQGGIFTGDFSESPPRITHSRRLTLDDGFNFPHAWTPDSRAVIFESNRSGGFDLFKQNLNEATPSVIVESPLTKMLAQVAPHGRLLYAARDDAGGVRDFKLMQTPLEGGSPAEVPIGGSLDEFRCALNSNERCVLRTTAQGEYYSYYELDPVLGKGPELARTKWTPGVLGDWDLSPDGKEIALPDHDSPRARIRVIKLAPHTNEPREHEVILQVPVSIHGLVWAAGGRGWFVAVQTTVGYRLLYVFRDGSFRPLGDICGWAVPSPDGARIAVWNHTGATNAWLVERH